MSISTHTEYVSNPHNSHHEKFSSHRKELIYKEHRLLGYDIMQSNRSSLVLLQQRISQATIKCPACFLLAAYLAYILTLKMEAVSFSVLLLNFY
jgi:hypothetical protein